MKAGYSQEYLASLSNIIAFLWKSKFWRFEIKFKLFITVALIAIVSLAFMPVNAFALTSFTITIHWNNANARDTEIIDWFIRTGGVDTWELEFVSTIGNESTWQVWVDDAQLNTADDWFIHEPNDTGLEWDENFPINQGLMNICGDNNGDIFEEE